MSGVDIVRYVALPGGGGGGLGSLQAMHKDLTQVRVCTSGSFFDHLLLNHEVGVGLINFEIACKATEQLIPQDKRF